MNIRPPAVAGQFYDNNPVRLRSQIEHWLQDKTQQDTKTIRAIIVPHAGYMYSGQTAAKAYNLIKGQKDKFKKVIVVGPSHRVYFAGCAVPQCDEFNTPLGDITVCKSELKKLDTHHLVTFSDELHRLEHSLEVQLPFLQVCLNASCELIPLMTCDISAQEMADIIDVLWDNETLLVISSDLSHFHQYEAANKIDQNTCSKIEHFHASVTSQEACGCTGINALLLLVKNHNYQIKQLQRNNSGDTSRDKSRVVGYVSYVITEL